MAEAKTYKYTNSLIEEDSPYLLQHAHNPVNWYAWSKKAFDKAKKEHKLIFLSIGYSTCHWCHVMERESFENEDVAKVLNDNYVAIKVDREEMPSIDKHFQNVYYLMHQRGGGWPLTIILTPNKEPFFSATYIPREPRYGRAGLIDVLKYFAKLQKDDPKKLEVAAKKVQKALKLVESAPKNIKHKELNTIRDDFVSSVLEHYDSEHKGIGVIPKFPHAVTISTLLDIYALDKNKVALKMAKEMLEAMAKGGIYDQIEGGFYRYSTDEKWMMPHYEKMLYTNAELLGDYAKAYKITKEELFKNIIKGVVGFVDKRFESEGVYFSASDADSLDDKSGEKKEGFYFVFDYKEAKKALEDSGIKEPKRVLCYLGITKKGNFEGKNNPYIDDECEKPKELEYAKEVLLKVRSKKPYPFIDKKILLSWNALYIGSLLEASDIFPSFKTKALNSLDSLLEKLYKNGKLYHQVLLGKELKVEANFEDYSFLISTLIEAYEKSFESRYLELADSLTKEAIERFCKDGVWYDSLKPFRVKATLESSSYANPLSVMIDNLLKLALLREDMKYQELAKSVLDENAALISKYPINFPKAVDAYLAYKRGYIVLKADKTQMKKLILSVEKELSYPFVLYKLTDDKSPLACKVDSCFAYGDIGNIVKKIKDEVKK